MNMSKASTKRLYSIQKKWFRFLVCAFQERDVFDNIFSLHIFITIVFLSGLQKLTAGPGDPRRPGRPWGPGSPCGPVRPAGPAGPDTPRSPLSPGRPGAPWGPPGPSGPWVVNENDYEDRSRKINIFYRIEIFPKTITNGAMMTLRADIISSENPYISSKITVRGVSNEFFNILNYKWRKIDFILINFLLLSNLSFNRVYHSLSE
jgi:hypothetical protein